jgi:hypothetical protein
MLLYHDWLQATGVVIGSPSPLRRGKMARFTAAPLLEEDLYVEITHIHHGKKEKNPVNGVRFFSRAARASYEELAEMVPEEDYRTSLPQAFEERRIRVFCKDRRKTELASLAFRRFAEARHQRPLLDKGFAETPDEELEERVEDEEGGDLMNVVMNESEG